MTQQIALLDLPVKEPPKRKRRVKEVDKGTSRFYKTLYEETPHEQALRFRRESAQIRAQLRQAQIAEDLLSNGSGEQVDHLNGHCTPSPRTGTSADSLRRNHGTRNS